MKDLKNLSDLLNQRFVCGFVFDVKIEAILYFSSRFSIEINTHKQTNEYVLHLQDVDGYVCIRVDKDEDVLLHINNFLNN